jgi:hypothetical protein
MKLKMIVAAIAVAASASAFAAGSVNSQIKNNTDKMRSSISLFNVRTDASYSQHVLDGRDATSAALDMLKSRSSGRLISNSVYVSGKGEIYGTYSNVDPSSNTRSVSTTDVKMPHVAFTSTIGNWINGFADLQITNVDSKNINFPNIYFTIGNLQKSPFYLAGGKKVIDFGRFHSSNNFAPTLTRAYFMAYGNQIAAGFSHRGIDATFTLINGFGHSLLNSDASRSTNSHNQLSDFAVSSSYNSKIGNTTYYVGAGYINTTGFNHTSSARSTVGAVDLNAGMTSKGFSINSEFLMTTKGVKGTNSSSVYNKYISSKKTVSTASTSTGYTALCFNTLPHLINFTSHSTVKAWSFDSSYVIPVAGKKMIPYVAYSHVAQNSANNIYQIEIGSRFNVLNTVWFGGSYNYTTGKSSGSSIGKFNTVMLDISAYF